ncbi:hypothetical protein ABEV34_01395 [Methylorubrum rhodesianum]|uniref:hypothetical protein n=1 Tax=Methylorubrum TaxID=2282523 RepID=UPI0018E2FEC1|nr:hypothetical protein [Methylorubrum sp. DB1722]MBI1690206.1 hypothetical protein [Methylorubrum sp. DB1722]
MKTHALILASLLLSTAAHAETEAPGPYTVKRDQPGCMGVSDLDRIRLKVMDHKHPENQEEGRRAFRELAEGPTVKATAGRRCVVIPKGTKVTVEKRTGIYDCVRYKGQPPAYYERTCVYTKSVTTAPLSGPAQTADWYWY